MDVAKIQSWSPPGSIACPVCDLMDSHTAECPEQGYFSALQVALDMGEHAEQMLRELAERMKIARSKRVLN